MDDAVLDRECKLLWDARKHAERRTGVLPVPVWRPDDVTHARPLWLVVARRPQGQEPWYLLTSEPVQTAEDAWQVVSTYARRWQIEMSWRYGKSELAMVSPRLWSWERRKKLLLLATLAYAFLLSLLAPTHHGLGRASAPADFAASGSPAALTIAGRHHLISRTRRTFPRSSRATRVADRRPESRRIPETRG